MSAAPDIEKLLEAENARNMPPKKLPNLAVATRRFSEVDDDRYRLEIPEIGVTLEIDRLRREHHELIGELSVWCNLPGAYTVDGTLSVADFNLSGARARLDRAKLLDARANTRGQLDWVAVLEEFCQRILQADRTGQPLVDLRTVPTPPPGDEIKIEGFVFPRRHPSIIFGDGDSAKSYIALYLAGRLAEQGIRTAFFDWELEKGDHKIRLEKLFPDGMPQIFYARCERPLVAEKDRLRRAVQDQSIEFAFYDSTGLACDGPPESAESANAYLRAARSIGVGSVHLAHINRSENSDKKPFGSAFWHNGARTTWFVKASEPDPSNPKRRNVGFFCRKSNLGPVYPPLAFEITFEDHATTFRRDNPAEVPDLAGQLSIRQRMIYLLRRGPMTREEIAENLDADYETVKRESNRSKKTFIILPGGKVGLVDRDL